MTSYKPNYLPKTSSPNTIILEGTQFSTSFIKRKDDLVILGLGTEIKCEFCICYDEDVNMYIIAENRRRGCHD